MANKENNTLVNISADSRDIDILYELPDIVSSILSKNQLKFTQSKLFLFPFNVPAERLEKIREEATTCLLKLNKQISISNIRFKAIVIFQDLMSVAYDNYDQFISKAGNKSDPVSIELEWSIFKANPKDIVAGYINILFETEKNFVTSDRTPGDFKRAGIKVSVSGSSQEWVENTFANISPFIEETKLAGIYRPLWIFRNKLFLLMVSHFIGFCAFIAGFQSIDRFIGIDERAAIINNILSEEDINVKIDKFAVAILDPTSSPWWTTILSFLGSMLLYVILYFLCLVYLPRLTPRSFIAIGLISDRSRRYYNLFKIIVLHLLILGIILPIFLSAVL